MNRFWKWISEWRGLQARLWLAREELLEARTRMLKAEDVERIVRQKAVTLELEISNLQEQKRYLEALLRRTQNLFTPQRSINAAELHDLLVEIAGHFAGRQSRC